MSERNLNIITECHTPRLGNDSNSGESSNSLVSTSSSGPTLVTTAISNKDKCDADLIEEVGPMGQSEMRKHILQIQADTKLSSTEKAKIIQDLMSKPFLTKQKREQKLEGKPKNCIPVGTIDYSKVEASDKVQTFHVIISLILGQWSIGLQTFNEHASFKRIVVVNGIPVAFVMTKCRTTVLPEI